MYLITIRVSSRFPITLFQFSTSHFILTNQFYRQLPPAIHHNSLSSYPSSLPYLHQLYFSTVLTARKTRVMYVDTHKPYTAQHT